MPERHEPRMAPHITGNNRVEGETVASLREQLDRMVFKESYLRGKLREADDKNREAEGRASGAEEKAALFEYDYERLREKSSRMMSSSSKLTSTVDAPVNAQFEARDTKRYRLAKREVAPDGDPLIGRLFDITRAIKMSTKQIKSNAIQDAEQQRIQAPQDPRAEDGIPMGTSAQASDVIELKHLLMQSETEVKQANYRFQCLQSEIDELKFANRRLKRKENAQDWILALWKSKDRSELSENLKVRDDYAKLSRDITKFATTLSQMPYGAEDLDAQTDHHWLKLLAEVPPDVRSEVTAARIAICSKLMPQDCPEGEGPQAESDSDESGQDFQSEEDNEEVAKDDEGEKEQDEDSEEDDEEGEEDFDEEGDEEEGEVLTDEEPGTGVDRSSSQFEESQLTHREDGSKRGDNLKGLRDLDFAESSSELGDSVVITLTRGMGIPPVAYPPAQIISPSRPIRCAFSIGTSAEERTIPIGNPFQDIPGLLVEMDVCAGRDGPLQLGLIIRIRKNHKDRKVQTAHYKRSQHYSFTVSWRLGVIDGKRMLDYLVFWKATQCGDFIEMIKRFGIVDSYPSENGDKLDRLVSMTFLSHSFSGPEISAVEKKPWKGLPTEIQHGFDCLFFGKGRNMLTVCFLADPDISMAFRDWMCIWQNAANSKKAIQSIAHHTHEVGNSAENKG